MNEGDTIRVSPDSINFHESSPRVQGIELFDGITSVGKLNFEDDGRLTFEGNTDASASVFFDQVIRINNRKIKSMDEVADIVHELGNIAWKQGFAMGVVAVVVPIIIATLIV